MKLKNIITLCAAVFLLTGTAVQAGNNSESRTGNILKNVIDLFTGKDSKKETVDPETPGAHGRARAVEQIDRNIDRKGGSHPGLENARGNVMRGRPAGRTAGAEKSQDSALDQIIDDIADSAKDEIDRRTGQRENYRDGRDGRRGRGYEDRERHEDSTRSRPGHGSTPEGRPRPRPGRGNE